MSEQDLIMADINMYGMAALQCIDDYFVRVDVTKVRILDNGRAMYSNNWADLSEIPEPIDDVFFIGKYSPASK
jgi:hypothetical protein